MKVIYVASPYSGDVERNTEYAKLACRNVLDCGHAFFAPHLLYPAILDDNNPRERERGIAMGCEVLARCDELWVYGSRVSEGMDAEIRAARQLGVPVRYFELTQNCSMAATEAPSFGMM